MPTSTQRFRLVGEDDASRAFLEVAAASKLLKSNIDDVNSSLLGLGKLVGGADLIPVLAGASAVLVELTTSLGAASGALGIFGLSAGGIFSDMLKAQKAIQVTEKSLAGLTKGTTQYADKAKELRAQQKAFNVQFGPAAKGYNDMTNAFAKFKLATSHDTTPVLGQGLELIASVLPKLVPASDAAAHAVGGLIGDLQDWTEGPSFAHLLHFLETSGPKDITAFGHSIGNVLGGLGGILSNFVGPGDNAAKTLEHLTADFDKWGHSKGVSKGVDSFLRYVGNNGPALSSSLQSLAEATPKIATALGKIGSANLTLTSKFLSLVAGLPQKQFNLIADGLFAIAAGSKALTLVTGLGAVGKGLTGILSGKGLVGKGSSILSRGGGAGIGVQKVFVVNMPPGGLGGGGVQPGGKVPPILGAPAVEAAGASALAGVAAAAAIALPFTALMLEVNAKTPPISSQFARDPGIGRGGPKAIAWAAAHGDPNAIAWLQMQANPAPRSASLPTGGRAGGVPLPPFIQATSTKLDALNARLGKASQGMDLVGHSALRAFPNATKVVEGTSAKLEALNGVKGEQAFDLIGNSASKNTASASRNIDVLTGKIRGIPDRNVKVTADTAQALSNIRIMREQVDALHGKTIIIRTTGGRVLTGDGGGASGGSGGGASGGSDTHHHSTTNNITIVAPAVGDPVSIGEQVAYYLGEFQAAG